ncbi:hypothetical protein [Catenulispora sp. GAS73]|uniref:hypothetical protein n=1 Tax=Catenulispora sp. GAS73 TaxID=3156269 RepID=UPI0035150D15
MITTHDRRPAADMPTADSTALFSFSAHANESASVAKVSARWLIGLPTTAATCDKSASSACATWVQHSIGPTLSTIMTSPSSGIRQIDDKS